MIQAVLYFYKYYRSIICLQNVNSATPHRTAHAQKVLINITNILMMKNIAYSAALHLMVHAPRVLMDITSMVMEQINVFIVVLLLPETVQKVLMENMKNKWYLKKCYNRQLPSQAAVISRS